MKRIIHRKALLLVACVAIGNLQATGKEQKKAAPHVNASTISERVANSRYNQPLKKEAIIFPHLHIRGALSGPKLVPTGRLLPQYKRDLDLLIWDVALKKDAHTEYLTKRAGLLQKGKHQTLIDWCVKNGLKRAAEYELRRALMGIGDFRKPGYKPFLKQWLKYADKRQVPYTFSLPVKGEWYVVVDKSKHHRLKAGAAYAMDLIIRKKGKSYSGTGRQLTDHYCWGQPIVAQADGVVMQVRDSFEDPPVGKSGGWFKANSVAVYYGNSVMGSYGHIQKGSAKVKAGQKVTRGQTLALVGNSGASGAPHLHFTLTDTGSFSIKGRYSYERKKGTRWVAENGVDLIEGTTIRDWEPKVKKTE